MIMSGSSPGAQDDDHASIEAETAQNAHSGEHDHAEDQHHRFNRGRSHAVGHDGAHEHGHVHPTGVKGFVYRLLVPHTHDAHDSIDDALEASVAGIRAVKISLLVLGVTAALQIIVVIISGSVALLADTIHNFADALTAVPLWIAFVLGRRPPTRRYTYGYGRVEDLAGLFILAMITFSAAVAGWESIDRLLHPQPISNLGVLVIAGLVGFGGNELVALYRIRVGKEIGSAALVADGYHARTDGLTSLAVVLGAIGVFLGFPQADPIVGLLITVAILWVLQGAAAQVFARLMDAVDPALTEAVERASAQPGVVEVTSTRLRWLGHRIEAESHVTVDCDLPTIQSHAIAESVRHAIYHDVPKVSDLTVHVDPSEHRVADPHKTTRHHLPTAPRGIGGGTGGVLR